MELLTIAKALGADDITSPTIPFVLPSGGVTPYPTDVTGSAITLSADVVRLKKDEKTIVKVKLNTDGEEIKSFKFKIQYNPTLFKVNDADTTTNGIQISYKLTFFEQKQNIVDVSGGLIEFEAQSNGSATITDREVAVFEIQALKDGIGEFKLLKEQSQLLDINGVDILKNVNSIAITISDSQATPFPTSPFEPSFETPKTALLDDNGSVTAILLGLALIATGYYLFKKRKEYDIQR